ncbi:hypothetical protein MHIP_06090 [Mycolicibacterium hippocampi]|uniref:DUF427 domain-containing protein n=2 Tax=Mycolicibacterium hippocampi TaxID=659824 RepID=A0A7I9ZH02_9MYCO|nr:hypothetical protein MHIP_06090 [Mycolicibacterium hippocampi]
MSSAYTAAGSAAIATDPWASGVGVVIAGDGIGPSPALNQNMTDRPVLQPSKTHPITIEPTRDRVTVRVDTDLVAVTGAALTLQEGSYPPVYYIPLEDVVAELLPSDTTTYCPFKGDAGYYHLRTEGGQTVEDALWTYREPFAAVAPIAGHVAFYPDKADVTVGA